VSGTYVVPRQVHFEHRPLPRRHRRQPRRVPHCFIDSAAPADPHVAPEHDTGSSAQVAIEIAQRTVAPRTLGRGGAFNHVHDRINDSPPNE
jgi:hypothetical protein